jgi:hypothetical protein
MRIEALIGWMEDMAGMKVWARCGGGSIGWIGWTWLNGGVLIRWSEYCLGRWVVGGMGMVHR